MIQRDQPDDTVTVHVTPRGGLYVNEWELLCSEAAQETMKRMESVMAELLEDADRRRQKGAGHPETASQAPSGER